MLRKRLLNDLAELQENPYPGIELHVNDTNALDHACLVLTVPERSNIHLTIFFHARYPL